MERGRSKTCIMCGREGGCIILVLCPQNLKEGDHFDSINIGERIMV
jgi:hypothetical protein